MTRLTPGKWIAPLVAVLAICLLPSCGKQQTQESSDSGSNSGFKVGYAMEGVTAVEDPDAMSKLLDEAYARAEEGRIALEYKATAVSDDGVNFSCYLANSVDNKYDMFMAIYADPSYTDELYLSQLLRPGTAFDHITLERKLEPGAHDVYIVFTTVETTEDEQIIHGQTAMGMDFIVNS
jgi:maltoporin